MLTKLKTSAAISIILASGLLTSCADAGPSTNMSKAEIETIVKDYILANPKIIREAFSLLQDQEKKQKVTETKTAIKTLSKEIFYDQRDFSIGPKDAKVTIVEFFDYNCTFCKSSAAWVKHIMDDYPKDVRVIFKELPILEARTKTSRNAAIAAMAAGRQGKYKDLHFALMNGSKLSENFIIAKAKAVGLNMTQFTKDRKDIELQKHLEATITLTRGIPALTGTPFFIINDEYVPGGNTAKLQTKLEEHLSK
ncbi:MAG: DsbA family protein [Robiginitomaculum sp.]